MQLLKSWHSTGQLPSQASFVSTTPFPQLAVQSSSLLLLQPLGQHPSPFSQTLMPEKTQTALQSLALPLIKSDVHARPSSQAVGQFPSQLSPASTTLLEQSGAQSSSLRLLQPGGQQPSEEVQAEITVLEQSALHVDADPSKASTVHVFWSSQLAGQSPSQISPASSSELPQMGWQSLSLIESQPFAQHSSLSIQD